jgi:hypothetical protein
MPSKTLKAPKPLKIPKPLKLLSKPPKLGHKPRESLFQSPKRKPRPVKVSLVKTPHKLQTSEFQFQQLTRDRTPRSARSHNRSRHNSPFDRSVFSKSPKPGRRSNRPRPPSISPKPTQSPNTKSKLRRGPHHLQQSTFSHDRNSGAEAATNSAASFDALFGKLESAKQQLAHATQQAASTGLPKQFRAKPHPPLDRQPIRTHSLPPKASPRPREETRLLARTESGDKVKASHVKPIGANGISAKVLLSSSTRCTLLKTSERPSLLEHNNRPPGRSGNRPPVTYETSYTAV